MNYQIHSHTARTTYNVPSLGYDVTPQVRKQTRANLDNVFSLIILSGDIIGASWNDAFTSTAASFYNNFWINFDRSPNATIKTLKADYLTYVSFARGGLSSKTKSAADFHASEDTSEFLRPFFATYAEHVRGGSLPLSYHRLVLALLSIHRVIAVGGDLQTSTVTDKSTAKDWSKLLSGIPTALSELGIEKSTFKPAYLKEAGQATYHLSNKGGPNGKAMWTANLDARAWMQNPELFKEFILFAKFSGRLDIVSDLLAVVEIPGGHEIHDSLLVLGRLHAVEEWGGKIRTVAILDYWTQALLTPLHNTINGSLRPLVMDGTFDQDRIAAQVKARTAKKTAVYSFDLTAATDRLPLEFQTRVLSDALGSTQAAISWAKLLVGRQYHLPTGGTVQYSVGQPMGAKSSFPMLALTHHVIVKLAAGLAGVLNFTDYVVLGDDITIANTDVAKQYLHIMDILGVTINQSKSVVHSSSLSPAGEICKRLFIAGEELSSFPVKLMAKTVRTGKLGSVLHQTLIARNAFPDPKGAMTLISGTVDTESLQSILTLNALPAKITGLHSPAGPITDNLKPENWYPDRNLTEDDLGHAYLYTLSVEQLKRLDGLLRQTQAVYDAVILSSGDPMAKWDAPIFKVSNTLIQSMVAELPTITPNHPIVKAARAEVERVTSSLSALRSGKRSLVAMAKSRLLDMFRNSLLDLFDDDDAARTMATHTLVAKALTHTDTVMYDSQKSQTEFTILLTSVDRTWTVVWRLGEGVFINNVRTRVQTSATASSQALLLVSQAVVVSPRARRALASSQSQSK